MSKRIQSAWWRTLGLLILVLALGAAVGVLTGRIGAWIAAAALLVVAWHYWRLRRLLLRLTNRRRIDPPQGEGVWNELDRLLHRGQGEMRTRKRRLIAMLRAYRAAAMALPDGVVVVNRNSQRILWFNTAAERLLGLQHPQDIDQPLGSRLQDMGMAQWLSAGRHAEPLDDIGAPHDDSIRLNLRLIPYSDDLWLLIARDVTKLMRLEQMRRDFVANVSHELRTPLTVLHGYLDMFDPEDSPEHASMFGEMQRQTTRMNQLVDDLLKLSRLEVQEKLEEGRIHMADMLLALQREAQAMGQQRHDVSIEDSAGVDLLGSEKELHSAFSNLVSNAVRYTPAGGRIVIRFVRDGNGVSLCVDDAGYGIPHDHLPRLTERFYRVSTSRSRESGGTGLGLAIVKHVLNLHQARLQIDSEVGRGSRFACVFGPERLLPRAASSTTYLDASS